MKNDNSFIKAENPNKKDIIDVLAHNWVVSIAGLWHNNCHRYRAGL